MSRARHLKLEFINIACSFKSVYRSFNHNLRKNFHKKPLNGIKDQKPMESSPDLKIINKMEKFEGPFKHVCAERPTDYSYYNKYDVAWSKMDPY